MSYETVIYSPTGWYASHKEWRDASYAFQHRNDIKSVPYGTYAAKPNLGDWEFLGNKKEIVAQKLNIPMGYLPEWDYEYILLKEH